MQKAYLWTRWVDEIIPGDVQKLQTQGGSLGAAFLLIMEIGYEKVRGRGACCRAHGEAFILPAAPTKLIEEQLVAKQDEPC